MDANGRFDRCLDVVCSKAIEGGFVNDPRDPGGPTNHGITQATLAHWRGHAVTVQDVEDLTLAEARVIYRTNYWNTVAADGLPAGLDLIVFDAAINQGPGHAAAFLQHALSVPADMHIGPKTLAAVAAAPLPALIDRVAAERLHYYRELPGWAHDGNGWTSRVRTVRDTAQSWVGAA